MTALDLDFVEQWADRYVTEELGDLERSLLTEDGPRIRERGHATLDELTKIVRWKSNRTTGYIQRNDPDDVPAITEATFRAPEHLRHRILRALHGVGTPVASAVLTVWDPAWHTVTDRNAYSSLRELGAPVDEFDGYPDYNAWCRQRAEALGVELRTLDRALWKWADSGHYSS